MKFPLSIKIGICVAWLFVAAAGAIVISNYENKAGRIGETPQHWPAQNLISLDSRRDTLVLFAHPQCPCTRASMEELNRLLARSNGRVAAHVIFFRPENFPTNWTQTDLWKTASAIPGVTVNKDTGGDMAKKFGAETSGYVALYNPAGELIFHGGITSGRGHIGDNVGESEIIALLTGNNIATKPTPVYGCSLISETCPKK